MAGNKKETIGRTLEMSGFVRGQQLVP